MPNCPGCGRQFVENPEFKPISTETNALIDKLLLEGVSLAGIVRVSGISARWLQSYVNGKYAAVARQVEVPAQKKGRLVIECDEIWSFVGSKANQQWVWLAIETHTRLIVGVFIGSRDKSGALGLWRSLPPVYRQCAICYSDFWQAYAAIFPSKRHRAVGKQTGKTAHIQRFTLRQRISRLLRKALSFSNNLASHIGAIWYVIHHYNQQRLAQLDLNTTSS